MTNDNDVKIMPKSIVCQESTLRGDITISPGVVVHPSAIIIAEAGPIIIGENCIIEEYAQIVHRLPATANASFDATNIMHIGANNVFEVGCNVEAARIGDKNVFECKCFVGAGIVISNGCVIGAGVRVSGAQELQENTVIYGRGVTASLQREAIDKHGSQTLQIDFLRKVLPNYHHLCKPNHDPKKTRNVI